MTRHPFALYLASWTPKNVEHMKRSTKASWPHMAGETSRRSRRMARAQSRSRVAMGTLVHRTSPDTCASTDPYPSEAPASNVERTTASC